MRFFFASRALFIHGVIFLHETVFPVDVGHARKFIRVFFQQVVRQHAARDCFTGRRICQRTGSRIAPVTAHEAGIGTLHPIAGLHPQNAVNPENGADAVGSFGSEYCSLRLPALTISSLAARKRSRLSCLKRALFMLASCASASCSPAFARRSAAFRLISISSPLRSPR